MHVECILHLLSGLHSYLGTSRRELAGLLDHHTLVRLFYFSFVHAAAACIDFCWRSISKTILDVMKSL